VTTVPERIRRAVDALDVRPDGRLLELGCGGGVAVSLVCERLGGGTITAVDRSPLQIERATRRNAAHVAGGKARFLVGDLESLAFAPRSFDTIFAINVNHFWTQPESTVPDRLARLLEPGGRLVLFFETPSPARDSSIEAILRTSLARAAFAEVTSESSQLLAVTARHA